MESRIPKAHTDSSPTEAQKKAGNYKKGHVRVATFDISIENPAGSKRTGVDADGKPWETTMTHAYGYIRGTEGPDGDHIDVFLSSDIDGWGEPSLRSDHNRDGQRDGRKVFVVDQYNPDGSFDEHKVMLGFNSREEAFAAYLSNYEKGWENGRRLDCTEVSLEDFHKWIGSSHRKTKPFAEYREVQNKTAEQAEPTGHGDFGPIFTQFKGKANEAARVLAHLKSGQAKGVFQRDEIGEIDLVWGSAPNPHSGSGLAHIDRKHVELLADFDSLEEAIEVMEDVIKNGKIVFNGKGKAEIEKGPYRVVIAKDNRGNWVLTAFDYKTSPKEKKKKKDAAAIGTPGQPNEEAGAVAPNLSDGKDSELPSDKQEKTAEKPATSGFGKDTRLHASGREEAAPEHGKHSEAAYEAAKGLVEAAGIEVVEVSDAEARTMLDGHVEATDRDRVYLEAVERGDMDTAQRMVEEAAAEAGYSSDSSYQGTSAFNGAAPFNGYGWSKAERRELWDNGEFEGDHTLGDYVDFMKEPGDQLDFLLNHPNGIRTASPTGRESIQAIREAIARGDRKITVYRSVPSDVKEGTLRDGDWVTPSKTYARENAALHGWGRNFRIIEQTVDIDDLWWDGNDINEWGFDSGSNSAYRNTRNNRKLLDPVTYDDNGRVIPLSGRFNPRKADPRYLRDGAGRVYGWTDGEKVFLNREAMNPETPLHEYTHLWDEMVRRENPELWERGKELMKKLPLWDEVRNDPAYADIRDNEDEIASEVHSRLTAERGARILERMVDDAAKDGPMAVAEKVTLAQRVKAWLTDMFRSLRSTLGKWTGRELSDLTAEDFAGLTLRDLARGLDPRKEMRRGSVAREVMEANPMLDDYHRGVRSRDDVMTFDEVLAQAEEGWAEYGDLTYPDMDIDMLRQARETGTITVYSSKPIEAGVFVTPSRMNAEDYAGGGRVYSKEVSVDEVAWTGEDEGQYAPSGASATGRLRLSAEAGDKEDTRTGGRNEKKSLSLRHGDRSEQNNDESAHASWNDSGPVASDAARKVEDTGDRGDIRVYEEGLGSSRDEHSEYSERDRREAESERLVGIARRHGQYIPKSEFGKFGEKYPKRSGESEVYVDKPEGNVYKIKDPYAKSPMKENVQPEDAIYEHLVHNRYFPETAYKFEGISDDAGDLRIVLSQEYIDSYGRPTQKQIEAALAEKGLYPEGKYRYGNDEVSVTDVTGDNALLGADGKVCFIDPIIDFKKPVSEILGEPNGSVRSEKDTVSDKEGSYAGSLFDFEEEEKTSRVRFGQQMELDFGWPDHTGADRPRRVEETPPQRDPLAEEANARIDDFVTKAGELYDRYGLFASRRPDLTDDLMERMDSELTEEGLRLRGHLEEYYRAEGNTPDDCRRMARDMAARVMAETTFRLAPEVRMAIDDARLRRVTGDSGASGHAMVTAGGEVVTFRSAGEALSPAEQASEGGVLAVPPLRKLAPGEYTLVERRFTHAGNFSFTGKERIESLDDVAYIFRSLEDYSIENAFAVLVRDGHPTIIHIGMGGPAVSPVDMSALRGAVDAFGADKIYFVHNHPSGNLRPSPQDRQIHRRLREMFPRAVAVDSIIIDVTSGRYGTFDESASQLYDRAGGAPAGEKTHGVLRMDRSERSPEGKDVAALPVIKGSSDVAALVSEKRLGNEGKVSYLLLAHNNTVIGNLHTAYTDYTTHADALADEMVAMATRHGASSVIPYGNVSVDPHGMRKLTDAVAAKSGTSLRMLDALEIDSRLARGYRSAMDEGMMAGEPEAQMRKEAGKSPLFRFAGSAEDFDEMRRQAEAGKGIVMPGLADKDVNVVKVPRHDFAGTGKEALRKAEIWAKENIRGVHSGTTNDGSVFKYSISNDAIEKFVSSSATQKSENIGVHLAALKKLPEIIGNSIEAEVHPDYPKDKMGVRKSSNSVNINSLIHRFYGAISIDGGIYRVKTTIREYKDANLDNVAHSYEVTQIELLEAPSDNTQSTAEHMAMTSDSSIPAAKLLKDIGKSYDPEVKLLDASEKTVSTPAERPRIASDPDVSAGMEEAVKRLSDKLHTPIRVVSRQELSWRRCRIGR